MKTKSILIVFVLSLGALLTLSILFAPGQADTSLAAPIEAAESDGAQPQPAPVTGDLSNLPLSFIANAGQTDPSVRFTVKGAGHTIFFTDNEIVFSASAYGAENKAAVVRLRFPGANPHPTVEGLEPLPGKANFYTGNDPAAWRVGVPTYAAVVYRNLYPGVDLVYSGSEGRLKSEFRLAAGADPALIQMTYTGLTGAQLRADGALALETPLGMLIDQAPVIYQDVAGARQTVSGSYALSSGQEGECHIGFRVGKYDPTLPLVIDPVLAYSSFLGGGLDEKARAIVANDYGYKRAIYVAGQTSSTDFPVQNSMDNSLGGQRDAFVTKFTVSGGSVAIGFSTYLGGRFDDEARGIAYISVAAEDIVYLTGRTDSDDFPTKSAADATYGGNGDAFVVKIYEDGTLGYSTYLGGSGMDEGNAIAIASCDNPKVYVTGRTDSTDFPVQNAMDATYNGNGDAFVTQVTASGASAFGFSTFLGGAGLDVGYGISQYWDVGKQAAVVYVTGRTESDQFPVKNALDDTYNGNGDAFVTQLVSTATAVQMSYSTFLGGAGSDIGYGIQGAYVDGGYNGAYVTGRTESTSFPTRHAFQTSLLGGSDAFVTKIVSRTTGLSIDYSTYLGGRGNDEGRAIVNGWGSDDPVYIVGSAGSSDWPMLNAIQARHGGGTDDAFVTQIVTRSGNLLIGSSTLLGGRGNEAAYGVSHYADGMPPNYTNVTSLVGWTDSFNWPTTANALDKSLSGQSDAFVAQVSQVGASKIVTTSVGPAQGGQVSLAGGGAGDLGGYRWWSFGIPAGAVAQPQTPVYVAPYAPPAYPNGPLWLKYWTGVGSPSLAARSSAQSLPADWLRPVTVTVAYSPTTFPGVDENDLMLYGQDDDGVWRDAACTPAQHADCGGYIRNPLSDTITVTTLYVGKLALGVEKPEKAVTGRVTAGGVGQGIAASPTALANVKLLPDLGEAYAVTTNASGYYTLSRLISGTYVITPVLEGYTFTPARYVITITTADVAGKDFTGAPGGQKRYIYLPLVLRNR